MSLIDDLKEQSTSLIQKIGQKIQESPTYTQMQDRYENLTPGMQKLSFALCIFFVVFVVLFYPLSKIAESQTALTLFEEKRSLIRDLFRTYRESSAAPSITIPPTYEGLRSSVDAILARAELLPEQNLGVVPGAVEGRLIPQTLVSNVMQIKLAKLNLKQIVDIGSAIAAISDSVKMKDMVITANHQDTRYFDATFKLYSLKVPEPTPEPMPEPDKNNKKQKGSDK